MPEEDKNIQDLVDNFNKEITKWIEAELMDAPSYSAWRITLEFKEASYDKKTIIVNHEGEYANGEPIKL